MVAPIVLALVSAGAFVGLAHAAVATDRRTFLRATAAMAAVAVLLVLVSPAGGAAILAPVLFSRMLVNAPVPATVDELLARATRARHPSEY